MTEQEIDRILKEKERKHNWYDKNRTMVNLRRHELRNKKRLSQGKLTIEDEYKEKCRLDKVKATARKVFKARSLGLPDPAITTSEVETYISELKTKRDNRLIQMKSRYYARKEAREKLEREILEAEDSFGYIKADSISKIDLFED